MLGEEQGRRTLVWNAAHHGFKFKLHLVSRVAVVFPEWKVFNGGSDRVVGYKQLCPNHH
jgi:hypothetical protein